MADEFIFSRQYDVTGLGGTCNRTSLAPIGVNGNCGCVLAVNTSGAGPDAAYDALDRYIDFCVLPTSKSIHIVWDFHAALGNQLTIAAWDGVTCSTVYSHAFCTLGSGAVNATVPAGTWRLSIFLAGSCNAPQGTTDLWSITITCN